MKLYTNGIEVFAFNADGSQDEYIGEDLTAINEVQANIIIQANQPAVTIEDIREALQGSIDTKAQSLGFSNGNALMLYAGFTNPFQPLAQGFATWEASVWVEAGQYKDEVIAGTKPMLTPEEAVALMPIYP